MDGLKNMAKDKSSPAQSVADEAKSRLQLAIDADSQNRIAADDDLKFAAGDQWPTAIKMQRELDRRPCLTINKTDTFVRNVVNNMRQQRPRIKVHPVADGADVQTSDVIEGLIRHIEVQSNADQAYDTAADYQVRTGLGYIRILAEYIDEMSWDQELKIERVRNPFSVYMDPGSIAPDGSDSKWCIVTGIMKLEDFRRMYPGKREQSFTPLGDKTGGYPRSDEIMIAEYFRVVEVPTKLLKLTSGKSYFEGAPELLGASKIGDFAGPDMIMDSRDSMKRKVKWSKINATEELESRDWAGKHIPIVPVYGAELLQDGKVIRYGMVRNIKDPQRMYNFWRTAETEFVALAPKAPWLMAEGQDEGHEDEWNNANIKNYSSLKYVPVTDDNGQTLPPPMRQQPQAIPAASVNAAMSASEDLKAVAGMFDPALGAPGQETSGTMVSKRQSQSDLSNYHFYDNLTRSIRWVGLLLLDLIPHYYNQERTVRIIGVDGNPKSTQINKQAVDKVLNDLTVGRYDVVMDTGPGYDTKRLEASDTMIQMVKAMPELAKIAGDMIVRQMDFPGANDLADRMAMANPLAQIDKEIPEDMPPEARQMLAQALGQVKQLQQQVQQLTMEKQAKVFGVQERESAVTHREMEKEVAETHRLHIREKGETDRTMAKLHTQVHDTSVKAHTSLQETLIDAHTDMAIHRQHELLTHLHKDNK